MRAAEGIFLFARESLEKVRENHIKVSSIRNITYYTHYYSYYYQYGLTLQLLYINKITNDDDDTGGSSCFVSSCVNPSSFFPCCGAPFQNYYQKNYRTSSSSFSSSSSIQSCCLTTRSRIHPAEASECYTPDMGTNTNSARCLARASPCVVWRRARTGRT